MFPQISELLVQPQISSKGAASPSFFILAPNPVYSVLYSKAVRVRSLHTAIRHSPPLLVALLWPEFPPSVCHTPHQTAFSYPLRKYFFPPSFAFGRNLIRRGVFPALLHPCSKPGLFRSPFGIFPHRLSHPTPNSVQLSVAMFSVCSGTRTTVFENSICNTQENQTA